MLATTSPIVVTSAEFVRQFGRWQDEASARAIFVTHHGRRRLAVISAAHYQDLLAGAGDAADAGEQVRWDEEVLDHVAQGFIAFTPDMRVSTINRAACAFLKLSASAVLGRSLAERLPGLDESVGYASLLRAARTGEITSFEMPSFAYPDRWLRFQTLPFRDGAACLFGDITDELEARRLADAKTATLAAMAVHNGIGRAKLSGRGTFLQVDEVFAGFAGFTPDGLLKARLTDILSPLQRAEVAAMVETVLTGGAPQACDACLLEKSGAERRIRLGLAPMHRHHGTDGAVVVASLL